MSEPNRPGDAPPVPRLTTRKLAIYAGRVVVAGIVVAIGLWATSGLSLLTGHAPPTSPHAATNLGVPAERSPEWLAPLQIPGGPWSIANLPWNLATRKLSRAEAEAEFLKNPPRTETGARADSSVIDVVTIVKTLGAEKRPQPEHNVYQVSRGDVRIALFTTNVGAERMLLGRVMYPAGAEGSFFLLEISPKANDTDAVPSDKAQLLPLPGGARLLATRADEQGKVIAELVMVDADPVTLRLHWERDGQRTEGLGDVKHGMQGVVCWKDQQAVHVWFWPRVGGTEKTLVLQFRLSAEEKR